MRLRYEFITLNFITKIRSSKLFLLGYKWIKIRSYKHSCLCLYVHHTQVCNGTKNWEHIIRVNDAKCASTLKHVHEFFHTSLAAVCIITLSYFHFSLQCAFRVLWRISLLFDIVFHSLFSLLSILFVMGYVKSFVWKKRFLPWGG